MTHIFISISTRFSMWELFRARVILSQKFYLFGNNNNKNLISFFNVFLFFILSFVGEICGGSCCSTQTENEVLKKSIKTFEGLVRHQLKNLKSLWQSTYNAYKGKKNHYESWWHFLILFKWKSLSFVWPLDFSHPSRLKRIWHSNKKWAAPKESVNRWKI